MQKILLIEDCAETQVLVRGVLRQKYQVICVASAVEGFKEIERSTFSLFLLDVSLPDMDGFQVCMQLRLLPKTAGIPVIFLTGRTDLPNKLMGFSLGADDYISKPFEPLELQARIDARLDKLEKLVKSQQSFWKGDLRFDSSSQQVFVGRGDRESEVSLTRNEFRLLHFLARNEGQFFSRKEILAAIWPKHLIGKPVLERTIDTHVCALRRKLSQQSRYVKAVPGKGYLFSTDAQ